MDQFFEAQTEDGLRDSEGAFTVSVSRARAKLGEYQMRFPSAFLLKIIQAAEVAGATKVEVKSTRREFRVKFTPEPEFALDSKALYLGLQNPLEVTCRALRHLVLGVLGAESQELQRLQWVTPSGSVTWSDGELQLGEQRSDSHQLVVRRSRTALDWIRGTVYPAEETVLRDRCGYGKAKVYLDGRLIHPNWLQSGQDDVGLEKKKRSLLESLVEGNGLWLVPPGSTDRQEGWRQVESEDRYALHPSVPLLYHGPTSKEPVEVGAVVAVMPDFRGPSQVHFVKDGVLLDWQTEELSHPGVRLLVVDPELEVDLSEFQVVKNEAYGALLARWNSKIAQLTESVPREVLKEALQACDFKGTALEHRTEQLHHWFMNHNPHQSNSVEGLIRDHFPEQLLDIIPHISPSKAGHVRKIHRDHLPTEETILAVYDDTVMGSAKVGFLLTARRICWKSTLEEPRCILWQDLDLANSALEEMKVKLMGSEIPIVLSDQVGVRLHRFLHDVAKLHLEPYYQLPTEADRVLTEARGQLKLGPGLSYYPHFPSSKSDCALLTTARSHDTQEPPLVFYDDTVFGGGGLGWVLTQSRLTWKNQFDEITTLTLAEISSMELTLSDLGVLIGEHSVSIFRVDLRIKFIELLHLLTDAPKGTSRS